MPPSVSEPFLFVGSAYTAHCLHTPQRLKGEDNTVLSGKYIPELISSVVTHKAEVSPTQNEMYAK